MPGKVSVAVDPVKCRGCGRCAQVCFFGNFEIQAGVAILSATEPCIDCGHCVAVCPAGAVSGPPGAVVAEPLGAERPDYAQLMALLTTRRSRREFKPDAVPMDAIGMLVQAAAQAPSALNKQQVRYTVISNRRVLNAISDRTITSMGRMAAIARSFVGRFLLKLMLRGMYDEVCDLLPEVDTLVRSREAGLDPVFYNAPGVILVHTPKSDICGPENAIYCASNILLAAETLGLGACVIGFVTGSMKHDPGMRKMAGVPGGHVVHTTVAVGYPEFLYARPLVREAPQINLLD